MNKEELPHYATLIIERNGEIDIAAITRSATEHKFIAMVRPGGISETIQPAQLQLTEEMIGRIVIQPDGTLKLDLAS
jgi:hypothetical protein